MTRILPIKWELIVQQIQKLNYLLNIHKVKSIPQPAIRLPQRPPDPSQSIHKVKAEIEPNLNFEENSPHQEGIITEMYKSPDKSYLEQPQELSDLVESTKPIHKYLPKQVDIDKIMDIIRRKVLKGTHLPLTIKEILLYNILLLIN